jgi:hypothetical protein
VTSRSGESVILDERIESPVWRAPIVRIRSIEVTDAALIRKFVQSLSLKTRYLRFMSGVKELSAPMVDRLTRVDALRAELQLDCERA